MKDYNQIINPYLEQLKNAGIKKIIAFSGGAEDKLENKVREIVEQSMNELQGLPLAILTGGTIFGLPKYATEFAKKFNFPVIGVYPKRGEKYAIKDLDFALEVEPRYSSSEWGDESEIFAKLADGVEIIGGGAGTMIEISHILKMNDARLKNKKEPVYIAPVRFLEAKSAADMAYQLILKSEQKIFFPEKEIIEDGVYAAQFLANKLGLR